jgi:transcriptional regulator of acetoin/glycerol metabolism
VTPFSSARITLPVGSAPAISTPAPVAGAGASVEPPAAAAPPTQAAGGSLASSTAVTLEEIEVETIRRAVEAAKGNISEASKRLGISRNTIYRKLRWNRSR